MTHLDTPQPALYCRQCGYALVGLSANRCPECGRGFDPEDRRTFYRHPRSHARRRWVRRRVLPLMAVLLLGAILAGAWFGWVYWTYRAEWQAEQEAIAALKETAGDTWQVTLSDRQIPLARYHWLPSRLDYLRTRVSQVAVTAKSPWQSSRSLWHASLCPVAQFRHCRSVRLSRLGIADDQLRYLKDLTRLTDLNLQGNPAITDDGLAHLKELTSLEALELDETGVTGAGLEHLQGMTRLNRLNLAQTRVRGGDVAGLARLPALDFLDLHGLPITDEDLAHLKGLRLTVLIASRTRIGDAGLAALGQANRLVLLWLSNTSITDAGLRHLSKMRSLRHLYLDNTAVTDTGLKHLEGLTRLRGLAVSGTKVTPEGIEQLKRAIPSLRVSGP